MERRFQGSARVSRVGDCVLAIANFSQALPSPSRIEPRDKVRFGATPKPTRETRALPRQNVRCFGFALCVKQSR